jgi:hypothetical protein
MRFTVPLGRTGSVEVSERKTHCPNARLTGHCTSSARVGALITYSYGVESASIARVLGRVETGECRGHMLVLRLSDDATFAYLRFVDPETVLTIRSAPTKFAAFFFGAKLPPADVTVKLANYGTLCEDHIDGLPERLAKWSEL